MVPVEVSVNCTTSGAMPLVGLAVKLATGEDAGGATVIVAVAVLEPPEFVTVKVTV